ncbi:hypothetical protein [Anabaena azotica]|uniref:Uncharacterized protein n=1 Tax=Anabaena azotica FACHB-119 TaxID=947527 RepID=A0ABR8DEB2_9NOST|nr:hypothetical protein [Anabaena azotica]MBD2505272.1 hypothetical protein [Anabaena azotica FACHB-119]
MRKQAHLLFDERSPLTIQNSRIQNSRIQDILPTARYANSWGFKPQLKICYVQT